VLHTVTVRQVKEHAGFGHHRSADYFRAVGSEPVAAVPARARSESRGRIVRSEQAVHW